MGSVVVVDVVSFEVVAVVVMGLALALVVVVVVDVVFSVVVLLDVVASWVVVLEEDFTPQPEMHSLDVQVSEFVEHWPSDVH